MLTGVKIQPRTEFSVDPRCRGLLMLVNRAFAEPYLTDASALLTPNLPLYYGTR